MLKRLSWLLPILILLLAMGVFNFFAQTPTCGAICYVDAAAGDDANSGSTPDQAKRTIQAAVGAVEPGGEVIVAAGDYVEQVFIPKNLTLRGAGAGSTIIRAPQLLQDSLPVPDGATGVHSIVTASTGAQVTMSGLSIVGPLNATTCDDETSGVYVHQGANLLLLDAEIRDIYMNATGSEALNGCQAGIAVRVGEYEGGTTGIATIERVVLSGFQKTGIIVSTAGSELTVADSEIIGAGPNLYLAQNGVQVSGGAQAVIRNTTIRDLLCENGSCGQDPTNNFAATGIILFGAGGGVLAEGNTIQNNDIGIYNLSIDAQFTGNTLAGNRYIGILLDEGSATITNNQIEGGNFGILLVAFNAELYGITNDSEGMLTRNVITGAENGIGIIDENQSDLIVPELIANYNMISGNEVGFFNPTEVVMELTCNFWGAADGPSGVAGGSGDEVTRNGNFLPYLTSDDLEATCVGGNNAPPVAGDDSAETIAGAPITIALLSNDSDPDGDVLGVTPGTAANGEITLNANGSITYTPTANFEGNERFTYTLSDGRGGIDEAQVLVSVQPPPNSPPDAQDDTYTTDFAAAVTLTPLANDQDAEDDALLITSISAPAGGTLTDNGDGSYLYTPNIGFFGKDTFNYTIEDRQGGSDSASITVEVLPPPNTTPAANGDSADTTEGAPVTISPLANDNDADGDTLSLTTATDPASGSITINQDGTITYTPDAGFIGEDSFDYSISDGREGAASASITVRVAPAPNRAPDAVDDGGGTTTSVAVTIEVLGNDNDPDGAALFITEVGMPANGSAVANSNGSITYTPAAGFVGTDSFTYTIADADNALDTATVVVSVQPAPNQPPVAQADSASTIQDSPVVVAVLTNDSDPNGDPLTVSSVTTALSGTAVVNADGTISYTPNAGYTGVDTFNYTVSDGAAEASAAVLIVVNALPNTPPVANDDQAQTPVDTPIVVDVLPNDSDADGDALTIASAGNAVNGTAGVQGTVILYTPSTGFVGTDSFTYTITDINGGSATARVTITVLPPENRPPQVNDDSSSTTVNSSVVIPVLANDRDPDGDGLTLLSVSNGSNGIASTNGDGTVVYAPNADFVGQDSFSYRVGDGRGGESEATVTVQVLPGANNPPDALDDISQTNSSTTVIIPVLANDSDVDKDSISISGVAAPANGTAVDMGDGTIAYTPNPDFTNIDTFSYTIVDARGGQDTATVVVDVLPPQPITGALLLRTVIDWSNVEPNPEREFKFCLNGPSFPQIANCQIVTELTDDSLIWTDLLPGIYTVKSGEPGAGWQFENSSVAVVVQPNNTVNASLSFSLAYTYAPITPTCPAGTNPIVEIAPTTIDNASAAVEQWIRITSPALVTVQVASMVGHPDRGCPFSDNRCNAESNEEFAVLLNQEPIEIVPDHGENQWQSFEISAGVLFEGPQQFAFVHTNRKGEAGATGDVTFAAVICAGAPPANIRTTEGGGGGGGAGAEATPTPTPTLEPTLLPDSDADGVLDRDDACPTQFGVAAQSGCPDADGDGFRDSVDACPTVAGVASANGCPDTDGDGIQNSADACPSVAGVASANGCPDSDGDGIQNSADACPTVAGQASANGCPDSDGDGIQNSADACPNERGVASANGCPDRDGDGIRDSADACPAVAGQASANGCPDSDGDGIQNSADACPTVAGVASANGCPDSDGDGIQNSADACPTVAGQASANGCPDSDGDGIQNSADACPTVAGQASAGGCPDSDGDGIQNSADACPTVAGQASAGGCPDSDGDGIQNSADACPTVAGQASANGCPDSDGDGIQNSADACPTVAGPPQFSGCPDSDGDGVSDQNDACPAQGSQGWGVGPNGCPLPNPDADGDGVPIPTDQCPAQGSIGWGVGADGCPLPNPDADGDGVPIPTDICPDQGNQGNGVDANGCPNPPPNPDADGDGVPIPTDICPDQGNQGNGVDANGCPIPPAAPPPSGSILPLGLPLLKRGKRAGRTLMLENAA
jgi:hypothetical protein